VGTNEITKQKAHQEATRKKAKRMVQHIDDIVNQPTTAALNLVCHVAHVRGSLDVFEVPRHVILS